ncbi:cold shock protein (beta-ribbon, CspA family) [Geodermatophilus telluris]|uniref:Cold shock protein (Beta-ribbon, CspA family) n=1 Tax=Geodermatophilus telluris TaxID=1190417 RepID=A0A1G6UFN7_9ACTN|nr:cold shock domain-containing protein [Geodermatophilus telluris]SDD40103.1 cold shock protein (beta-ribbon, CspA family) [Geodermatophilus telluris]
MTSLGTVRVWHAEEGWGVVDSADTPGGCWVHFSAVLVAGYRTLDAGQPVAFTAEAAEQDGHPFRAVEVWPAGQAPVRDHGEVSGPSAAHSSTLTLTSDEETGTGPP